MLKPIFIALLSFILPFSNGTFNFFNAPDATQIETNKADSGILEKMIVANGNIAMNLDLNKLNGTRARAGKGSLDAKSSGLSEVKFDVQAESFYTVLVYDNELRGPMPSSMNINPKSAPALPTKLSRSFDNLLVEQMPFGEHYELTVRDRKSGFKFFNIEGHLYDYNSETKNFNIHSGRVLISSEFARELRRPNLANTVVGNLDINVTVRPIEVTNLIDGKVESTVLPAGAGAPENAGTRPGPDVVVGDVFSLGQFGGQSGTQVGLALGTTSCNYGTEDLNWFRLPNNDHPVIPQNLYRMNADGSRFEQVGQSQVKHAFTALTQNLCGLGCNGTGGSRLGSGCSDPYGAGLNSGPNLGSKAWINPFTGFYPRGDGGTSPNTHSGHSHQGPDHRIRTEINDLSTQMNVGARYFAEGHYVTPHEYDWCQSNPTQCNMYNNASYREYTVNGVGSPFNFSPVGSTVREKAAIQAWAGATFVDIEPDPGNDGVGTVAYKVTETSPGVWHYEYAVYNQNLDRAIQSFSVPLGNGVSISNTGFHAPPQHPGAANDGTLNDAGFSESPWSQSQAGNAMTWSAETMVQNENANVIRWGTMYNFRFESTSPPQMTNATVGFFKTGAPITVQVQGPSGIAVAAVSVGGRVTSSSRGVRRAYVRIDNGTNVYTTFTNQFGNYQINGVVPGTYTVSASAKRYTFASQSIAINDNLTGVDFEAQ